MEKRRRLNHKLLVWLTSPFTFVEIELQDLKNMLLLLLSVVEFFIDYYIICHNVVVKYVTLYDSIHSFGFKNQPSIDPDLVYKNFLAIRNCTWIKPWSRTGEQMLKFLTTAL